MFLVKADTVIQVEVPKTDRYFYTSGWRPYTTKEDKIYDKHEVYDLTRVSRDTESFPDWICMNVLSFGKVVLVRDGKYALVNPCDMTYLD